MSWLADPSESSVRHALAAAVPELSDAQLEIAHGLNLSEPEWASATAVVDGAFVVKFAWSELGAARVLREARVLETLARAADLPVPQLLGVSADPVAFVTVLVPGRPLHGVHGATPEVRERVARQLAAFLARLHDAELLDAAEAATPLVPPLPQGATDAIRERLPRFLDRSRSTLVAGWCDWVDEVLARPAPQPVLAHGDLHGHNQIWSRDTWTLRLVADFEVAGPTDPEYDFRYFPAQDGTAAFVTAIRDHYTALTPRTIDLDRVLAWHIRTALGDALWRSEAGIPLPYDGTPGTYVDGIERLVAG